MASSPGLKLTIALLLSCCQMIICAPDAGADAFLIPSKYYYDAKQTPVLQLVVSGVDFSTNNSFGLSNIQQLKHYAPDGHDYDLQVDSVNYDLQAIKTAPLGEGTQMVILHSRNITNNKAADSLFATVKKMPGFVLPDSGVNARLSYQLSLKTIFQAGKILSNNCLLSTSLPLDIVPERNPYSIHGKPGKLVFTLLFKGLPVINATLQLCHKKAGQQPPETTTLTTDKHGKIKTVIEPSGEWSITCVKLSKPLNNTMAGWQYYLSSVTWGYQHATDALH